MLYKKSKYASPEFEVAEFIPDAGFAISGSGINHNSQGLQDFNGDYITDQSGDWK